MTRLAVMGVGRIGGEVAFLAASLGLVDELVLYDSAPAAPPGAGARPPAHRPRRLDQTDPEEIRDAGPLHLFRRAAAEPLGEDPGRPAPGEPAGRRRLRRAAEGFPGVLITVTNPMDVNNYYLCTKTGIPRERCIGFGGQLDSARFGLALREHNIAGLPSVLGEHGEHQVPVFSRLDAPVAEPVREEILHGLRGASMEVIKGKGGTVFGPALHLARLARMVLADTREPAICSAVLDGEYGLRGCSLGVPVRIGKAGIREIEEWKLDPWEAAKMDEAGAFVTGLCKKAVA